MIQKILKYGFNNPPTFRLGTTELINSNEEMQYVIKIIQSFE